MSITVNHPDLARWDTPDFWHFKWLSQLHHWSSCQVFVIVWLVQFTSICCHVAGGICHHVDAENIHGW